MMSEYRGDRLCFPPLVGRKRRGAESGQELVEYALVFPFLFLLLFGLLEVGLIVYSYNAIANGARAGARYGIIHPDDTAGITAAVRREFYSQAIRNTASITPKVISVRGRNWIEVEVTYPVTLTFIAFAKSLPKTWKVTKPIAENMKVQPTFQLKAVSRMPIE